jgi:polysaccharide export outer membrane protein
MKVIFRLFLIITLLLATTEAFCEEKKSTVKLGSIGQTLVDSYQIGIGDILGITTWKEPDFTRENVLVRTDGKISFPLLNDFPAAGLSPMELKYNIEAGLKSFIEHPVVTIHIVDPVSQKFYILGEVMRTGEYPLVKHLTVLQAFALAGGFTEWASKKEIILLRHEGGKDKIFRINYKEITKGQDFSQNLKLQADDTIIVP